MKHLVEVPIYKLIILNLLLFFWLNIISKNKYKWCQFAVEYMKVGSSTTTGSGSTIRNNSTFCYKKNAILVNKQPSISELFCSLAK